MWIFGSPWTRSPNVWMDRPCNSACFAAAELPAGPCCRTSAYPHTTFRITPLLVRLHKSAQGLHHQLSYILGYSMQFLLSAFFVTRGGARQADKKGILHEPIYLYTTPWLSGNEYIFPFCICVSVILGAGRPFIPEESNTSILIHRWGHDKYAPL